MASSLKVYHMKKISILLFVFYIGFEPASAQQNVTHETSGQPAKRNLHQIREAFYQSLGISDQDLEAYRQQSSSQKKGEKENTDGILSQFHRWEWLMLTRVDKQGNLPDPAIAAREFSKYKSQHPQFFDGTLRDIMWEPVGTADVPSEGGGAGRTNVLEFDPANSNIMYVGAAGGGVWKTTDAGVTWTSITDGFPNSGVADIAISKQNSNTIYVATGDGYGYEATWQADNDFWGGVYSSGIMKSTDGGLTWNTTGLSYEQDHLEIVQRVVVNPENDQIVLAATRGGIYYSDDAGVTFTKVSEVHCYDFAFKPDDANTVYSGGEKNILQSTDAGLTWTSIHDGMDNGRLSIETTAANPQVIYAFSEGGKFKKSSDGGITWDSKSKPNSKTSFYGYYDTDFGVSDVDENALIAGGLEIVMSNNGADSWTNVSSWDAWDEDYYVHADGKCSEFLPGSATTAFSTNDGGIFITYDFGETWKDLSNGLRIAQIYRLGTSLSNPDKVISGWQDNGSNLWDGTSWRRVYGADGMEAAIDPINENILYEETQYGGLNKSTDNGFNWQNISPSGGDWVTPYIIDPVDNNTLYYGGSSSLYKSTNAGQSWDNVEGNWGGALFAIAVAPGNNQYVYAASLTKIKRSSDGGNSWTDVTAGLPLGDVGLNYIAVDNNDPENVFVALSAYSAGEKVYQSTDAGATWSNISGTLPNIPVNTIVYHPDSQNGVYIGTDLGVFYRDNTLADWIPFMNGLPNVMVHELEINNTSAKLVAATYGRGIWQSDLYGYVQYTNDVGVTSVINLNGPECIDNIAPAVKVKNFGSNAVTTFDLTYSFDGGNAQVYNWAGNLDPLQTITVTLPDFSPAIGEHSFAVSTASPNGLTDNNLINDADTTFFVLLAVGDLLPLTEDYEAGTLPAGWIFNNDDELWGISTAAGGYGQSATSLKANFFDTGNGKRDDMVTPYLDLTGSLIPIKLTFDYAYAPKNDSKGDTLSILVSTDCGTNWTKVFYKGGDDLATAPYLSGVEYVPANGEWSTASIDLSSYATYNRVLIKFEGISKKGNSMYLDNINLSGIPSDASTEVEAPAISVFPNPSNGVINFRLAAPVENGRIEVVNVLGQVVRVMALDSKITQGTITIENATPGIYDLTIVEGETLKYEQSLVIE
jgi:photosystem II stability/assembly factor-like uncharacterized protein